jgi:hypothetical protein
MKKFVLIAALLTSPAFAGESSIHEHERVLAWHECERRAYHDFQSAEFAEAKRRAHFDCMLYDRGYVIDFDRCPWGSWVSSMPNWWCWKENR